MLPEARALQAGRGRARRAHDGAPGHARVRPAGPAPGPAGAAAALATRQLTDYAKCGYRFYLRRVLGLPDVDATST